MLSRLVVVRWTRSRFSNGRVRVHRLLDGDVANTSSSRTVRDHLTSQVGVDLFSVRECLFTDAKKDGQCSSLTLLVVKESSRKGVGDVVTVEACQSKQGYCCRSGSNALCGDCIVGRCDRRVAGCGPWLRVLALCGGHGHCGGRHGRSTRRCVHFVVHCARNTTAKG